MLIETSFISRTVGIDLTFDHFASYERIARKTGRTFADGAVIVAVTLSVDRAWIRQNTRVNAITVVADFIRTALIVRFTTN